MSYDINVLVNGNRCRQYLHKGRTYIEAKEGSEYVIEIKNNSWEKVLAVVSVDGLNVVDGKAADENGPGYVMDKYTAQKLYGFQYSPEKVATFKFGAFGATAVDPKTGEEVKLGYAASKGDGSEKNAGIIGVRVWDEVPKPQPVIPPNPYPNYLLTASFAISCSWSANGMVSGGCYPWHGTGSIGGMPSLVRSTYSSNPADWNAGGLYGPGKFGYSVASSTNANTRTYPENTMGNLLQEAIADAKAVRQTACANAQEALKSAFEGPCCASQMIDNSVMYCSSVGCDDVDIEPDKASFDMETQWGASRTYKVKEVEFERREVVHRFDIYYASRESLILMGVDLGTEKRVSFPESFKESKYAKPPKGWKA